MAHYVYKKAHVRALMAAYDTVGRITQRKRTPERLPTPKHICCLILHQIGDVVLTLPTIEAIHHLFPDAKLTLVLGKGPTALLKDAPPYGATIVPFDADWQKVVRQLAEKPMKESHPLSAKEEFLSLMDTVDPDIAIAFHPDVVVNQLLAKTNIPITLGFTNAGGGFHLTHPVTMPQSGHQAERNFALAAKLAQIYQKPIPERNRPQLPTAPAAEARVIRLLHEAKIEPKKLIVLHPFASAVTKNWPTHAWAGVIVSLAGAGWQPVIIGAPNDKLVSNDKSDQLKINRAKSFCGQLSLAETTALLKHSALFIGIDSGPAHIAGAVNCPLISIYSSVNDPDRWHPLGPEKKTIVLYKPVADRKRYPYEMRDLPPGITGNPYSDQITPQYVLAAVRSLTE